jgi:hypothetical protein
MAAFHLIIYGRFWVITEANSLLPLLALYTINENSAPAYLRA